MASYNSKIKQTVDFLLYHLLFFLFFFSLKPSYSSTVLAYLAFYSFFYLVYVLENIVKETDNSEAHSIITSYTPLLLLSYAVWLSFVFWRAEWWKDLHSWIGYFGIAAILFLFAVYVFKWASKVDCRKVAEALAPLAVFHFVYGLATMISTAVAGVDVYRILLWYFAVYPAALATAVAGGERLAMLTALALYLTAYVLGTEPLLLLLVAVPALKFLRTHA